MKMKKLLSIGALGLVLACSTSIGASAGTISNSTIIKIIANQYNNGTNQTGLFEGVKKDTKIGTILTSDFIKKIDTKSYSEESVNKVTTALDNNANNTISDILKKVTTNADTFSKFQEDFINIATKVQAMDQKVGQDRSDSEIQVINNVKAYDASLVVTFGKDSAGKTTASINKNEKILVQLNYDNIQTIIDGVRSLTFEEVNAAKALV